jgi:transcriptional regulator with XRE-family HTH domain
MFNNLVGEVIRELRNNANLSQEKLAELSNLDRTYISLIERGKRQPTIQTLFKIAKSLGIPPSEIISVIEKRNEDSF